MTETRGAEPGAGGHDRLADDFEAHRKHLRAVAYRVLGSASDADDAVQEAWIRLGRSDTTDVTNLGGWLTTVVARVSLDMLRSRSSRREDPWDTELAQLVADGRLPHDGRLPDGGHLGTTPTDPAAEAELADSVGTALLVVLEALAPAERLAFVLHDLFGLPFDEIAEILDRSPAAARQLASRARRRVRSSAGPPSGREQDRSRQREVVAAFLSASRGGDLAALLALLDPDVVLRSDAAAVAMGSAAEVHGASAVAETFNGRAQGARLAAFEGQVGAVWTLHGAPRVAFAFTVENGRVAVIDLLADPDRLGALEIDFLRD